MSDCYDDLSTLLASVLYLYSNRARLFGFKKSPIEQLFYQKQEILQPTRMKNIFAIVFILVLYNIVAADSSSKYCPTHSSRINP